MKNEFSENDEVNSAINTVYQSMYTKTDRGVKNGETNLTITSELETNPHCLADQVSQYFDGFYLNAILKKYFISIDVQDEKLLINFKWGHHAIVANQCVTCSH